VEPDAEPVGDLVADERCVRRSDLCMVVVVVAGPVGDVTGQCLGQLLARVLVHEIDDVVRHECREPARSLMSDIARTDMCRCGGLHLDRAAFSSRGRLRVPYLPDEPTHQVGVRELEDDPVGDPSGHRDRHRPVPRDPHRQGPAARPREDEVRALVRDRATGHERPDDADRLLGVGHRDRWLPEDATRRIAAADAEIHPAVADLVEHGQ
jgi:hypothetical protein